MITGNTTYAKMMLPAPVRVWRYRLQPMTVGHYALLCRLGHPAVESDQVLQAGDLATAIWVLKNDHQESYKLLGSSAQQKFVVKIGKYISKKSGLHVSVLNDFYRYWAWQHVSYDIWQKEDEGSEKEKSMSWLQTIRWMLMSEWGYSATEVMDMPYKLAVNDALGAMVAHGKLEFVSDKQVARREFLQSKMKDQNA